MKTLEKNVKERCRIVESYIDDRKEKIKQMKEESKKWTQKTREEQQRQANMNLDERNEQSRARFTRLRNGIIEGHRRLQSTLPLLMLLNQQEGNGGGRMDGLLHAALITLTRFTDAANVNFQIFKGF